MFANTSFTPLESAVLNTICERHPADRAALESQLSTAVLVSRENTGAGFYTNFSTGGGSAIAVTGKGMRGGPEVKVDGIELGMGFILWLEDGYANCLEGYTYEGDTHKIDLERVRFEVAPG